MINLIAYMCMGLAFVLVFSSPWLSVVFYNTISILQPQYIWTWELAGIPMYKTFAGLSLVGLCVSWLIKKDIDFSILNNKQNLAVIIIFIMVHLSDVFSPYQDYFAATPASLILSNLNIIVLFYFISQLTLSGEKAYKYAVYAFILVVAYYVYWSNDAYFSGSRYQFNQGRLQGPYSSPYQDENKFSTIFVMGLPFLIFGFMYVKKLYLKLLIGVIGPLSLHSVFLTGSRGALMAVAVSVLLTAVMVKSKKMTIMIVVGFLLAVSYQASTVLNRSTEAVDAAEAEEEVNPRVRSWTIGYHIIKEYPLLGVGVARFQHASVVLFPEFGSAYVAHNTFFQIASGSGLLAGFFYLYILYYNYKRYRVSKKLLSEKDDEFLSFMNNSVFVSLIGFFILAIFLDMLIFEFFYYVLMLSVITHYRVAKMHEK